MAKEYLTYISLFSGIGGFEKGIQESKYGDKLICTHYSEIDKYAESIYKRQFPSGTEHGIRTHQPLGDITKVQTSDLPDFDLLVGGFPCQAFSVAGLQGGFNDTRGTLFFEIARVLRDKRPRYFLLENVKGLLGHDKGKTFQTILEVLSGLGYDVKWEVLNSKEFGVPQNRERIFIKGYSRTECRGEVLPFRKTGSKTDGKLNTLNKHKKVHQGNAVYDSDGLACTQTSNTGGLGRTTGLYKVNKLNNKSQAQTVYDSNGLSCTLSANGGGQGGKTGLYKINATDVKIPVRKRKHTANVDELKELLQFHKKQSGLSNNEIAHKLDVPRTTVEHWFRKDEHFSIPSDDIWYDLKTLLGIGEDKFDAFITEFEILDGQYDMRNRYYDVEGIAPTLNCNNQGLYKVKQVNDKSKQSERIYDSEGLSRTLSSGGGGGYVKTGLYKINKVGNFSPTNHYGKNVYSANGISPTLCSESVRKNGLNIMTSDDLPTFKKLEDGRSITTTKDGDCFCLTTSQQIDKLKKRKSNFVIEQVDYEPEPETYEKGNYSIRRLTPVECERLQGFPDNWTQYGADGEKISDTQRYKCCGNAVTVNVIRDIFNNWDLK